METMETPWRIELLGWLRAEQGERVVTRFVTRKTAALLACLALWPRRAHAREELIDRLWPDADLDAGRQRLRQALTSLRRQLEPPGTPRGGVLIADRTHCRLNPDAISTDVADFEAACRAGRLSEALAQYHGDLLPGFYEDWISDERERLAARADEIAQRLEQSDGDRVLIDPPATAPVIAAATPSVHLPLQFTRFFGREEERARIGGLLSGHRLVTLTGPGGAGKTRLAIEVARRQTERGLIAFVGLAALTDGTRIAEAAAEALRLPPEDHRPDLDRLADALAAQPTLLVLDNAEHLAAQAGPMALALLSRVPSLHLLVTSRRRLHIAGERRSSPSLPFRFPRMAAPWSRSRRLTPCGCSWTVRQAVRPDFQVTARNAADVGALCRRLEGSPLALELAAARAAALVPAQMLDKLAQRFALLATTRADKDARHRSLWAAIAWSEDLLSAPLRHFWRSLCVFRGSFTAEAAAAVTGEDRRAGGLDTAARALPDRAGGRPTRDPLPSAGVASRVRRRAS